MKTLIVILGPTAVGKTELSISLAKLFNCDIISADSRQMYKSLDIGTAKPTKEELATVKHHFIDNLNIEDYYSAAQYEQDVLQLIASTPGDYALMVGGSMMYIDAVCKGIDDIPTIDEETRNTMKVKLQEKGLEALCEELRLLDPEYYKIVDHKNTQRVVHALEICYMTGKTYTSFRTNQKKQRPFNILKIGLTRSRENLFNRINTRVDIMIKDGFLEEVNRLATPYIQNISMQNKQNQTSLLNSAYDDQQYENDGCEMNISLPNSLNTVGYKEMLKVLTGEWKLEFAVERMKKNTRVYAKKQMTWFKKDETIHWFDVEKLSPQQINLDIYNLAQQL